MLRAARPGLSSWLRAEMPNTLWSQRQTPRSSVAASETFGYQPGHVRQQIEAGLPRVAAPQSPGPAARRPRAQRRPPGTGWAGKGRWPARCADVQSVLLARLRLKNRGGSLGLRAYSMTPGAAALRLVCALSLSVFSLWQSPDSACKVCTLPAKACLTGTTWSTPGAGRQPAAAQRALAAGQALAPVLLAQRLAPPPQHRSSGSSRILVPHLSLSPQHRLLMATLGLSPTAISWRRASRRSLHQNSPGCTSAASKRLHSWMGGRVCLASLR